MRVRTATRSGIVIRRRTTPRGDLLVWLLTPQGQLRAVARGGARGPHASRLNLFHHVDVQVYAAPGADLATVQQATLVGALPSLAQPERFVFANLMAEFAALLFQEGEFSGAAFELFAASLRGVAFQDDPEWVALVMSYKLLALAGFVPDAGRCAKCGAPDPNCPDPVGGALRCAACAGRAPYPAETTAFLRGAARRTVRASMDAPVPAGQRRALWRALERFVTAQVGPLRSWSELLSAAARP
ncbi:DNA repair protein RecO [Deinococcus soli (ex Cha et al. 2016)]|uniref:DNA repair protein RecO (Recombination protein O) n=2 Tax=Deinococcus soli (ex Cha et al. 2016) TaxID=1309411 RepID=A0ACC6KFM1_9DEIO|nr:DNA repair protein RecO [Deinococcus soli (ex Cha et al. 2016)]MDR6218244.1 DNA repair protein RecO (recombination protein O) [Deinococcus soli (ex Cha et al. 2016)]MDR6328984.1 DNA repair protein RecO (recombination protein O) [Deinococcus soli (ex Cha et al. 2016)]MDR6751257.1 DNA repair protein RecO (recombination protein O) [Deinococcus soli (ex Cha et al. 2016)]